MRVRGHCRRCLAFGLCVSALIHGAGMAWALWRSPTPLPVEPISAIELDLAVFKGGDDAQPTVSDAQTAGANPPGVETIPSPPPASPPPVPILPQKKGKHAADGPRPAKLAPKPRPSSAVRQSNTGLRVDPPHARGPLPDPVRQEPKGRPATVPQPPSAPSTLDSQETPRPRVVATLRVEPARQGSPPASRPGASTAQAPVRDSELNDLFGLGFSTGASRSRPAAQPAGPVATGRGSAAVTPGTGRAGAAGSAAPATRTHGDAERAYLAELQRAIARYQHFPDEARRVRRSGVVAISFVVQADGRIQQVGIARSSGDPILDQAAMNALGQLGRFKPIPAEIGRSRWPIRVPIRFDLR